MPYLLRFFARSLRLAEQGPEFELHIAPSVRHVLHPKDLNGYATFTSNRRGSFLGYPAKGGQQRGDLVFVMVAPNQSRFRGLSTIHARLGHCQFRHC